MAWHPEPEPRSAADRGPIAVHAASNRRSRPPDLNAVEKVHGPAFFAAVDGHDNLGLDRRVFGWIVQNEEVGAELSDGMDVAVDAQGHANVGGVTVISWNCSAHEL